MKNFSFSRLLTVARKLRATSSFQAFPQNVICTEAKVGTDPYGKPAIVYTHKDGIDGIARDLHDALTLSFRLRLNLELYNSNGIKPPTPDPVTPTPTPKQETQRRKEVEPHEYASNATVSGDEKETSRCCTAV